MVEWLMPKGTASVGCIQTLVQPGTGGYNAEGKAEMSTNLKRSVAIAILLSAFCGVSLAVIHFSIAAPQDDGETRKAISDHHELKSLAAEYRDLLRTRLWPLKRDDIAKVFGPLLETATNWWGYGVDAGGKPSGPELNQYPVDLVLPIFVGTGMMVSGLHTGDPAKDKSHTDLHAIGDIGYVELYYQLNGESIQTAVIYFRADVQFVPLKSTNDLPKRLAWDKGKFDALKEWLDAHHVLVEDTKELSPNAASKPTK
jgi:hypothetical protein